MGSYNVEVSVAAGVLNLMARLEGVSLVQFRLWKLALELFSRERC